jgi:hypothetical protein
MRMGFGGGETMPGRGPTMWRTAGCCSGGDDEVTQVAMDDRGFTVGIVGLKQVFEQLYTVGRKPEAGVRDELLAMVKTGNYVPPSAEERYKAALLREYANFCTSKETR